ncbi:hypothetical protein GCM10028784_12420 [Myceligenerans cantabricum]
MADEDGLVLAVEPGVDHAEQRRGLQGEGSGRRLGHDRVEGVLGGLLAPQVVGGERRLDIVRGHDGVRDAPADVPHGAAQRRLRGHHPPDRAAEPLGRDLLDPQVQRDVIVGRVPELGVEVHSSLRRRHRDDVHLCVLPTAGCTAGCDGRIDGTSHQLRGSAENRSAYRHEENCRYP